jgi:SWI/SNF-related matrix-associated actin-dependent regulator 1 of chromatin subfamily A
MLIAADEKTLGKLKSLGALYDEMFATQEAAKSASRAASGSFTVDGLGGTLMPFQAAGVDYVLNHAKVPGRSFVADEQGLGKTVEALAAIKAKSAFPAVIVCESHTKYNWQRESRIWLPGHSVYVIEGRRPMSEHLLTSTDVLIVNYDVLKYHVEALLKVAQALVVDESHRVKNPKAQRTQAVAKLVNAVPEGNPVLLLTGTAVLNRTTEIITQLRILGYLGEFQRNAPKYGRTPDEQAEWDFKFRYCDPVRDTSGHFTFNGGSNLGELNDKLRTIGYVRRLKKDVLPELPAKMPRAVVPVEITNRKEYERAVKDFVAWLNEQGEDAPMDAEHLVKIGHLRRLAAQGKLQAMVKWVESFIEQDKLVIFAHHIEVQDALLDAFPTAAKVVGGMSAEDKDANVQRFQNDPNCTLIVCSLQAANTGITLTASNNVAFAELGWTPGAHDQAEDRCHRIGQKSVVTPWYLLAQGTIDEDMAELIEAKRQVVTGTTDGDGEIAKLEMAGNIIKRLKESVK